MTEDGKNKKEPDGQDTKEFFLKMYEKCWENVTNAEDALWKVFAAYTAVFAGIAIAKDMIGFFGFILLVTVFSIIGMFTAINANSWFARNIGMIANLEKILLPEQYWNKTIPKNWITGKVPFINIEIWWIMFALFPIVIFGTLGVVFRHLTTKQFDFIIGTIVIGFILVLVYFIKMYKKHKNFLEQAPG